MTNAYKRLHRGRAACVWHCRTACFVVPYGPFGIVIRPVLQGKTTAAVSGCGSGCYAGMGLDAFFFTLPAALRACGGMALLYLLVGRDGARGGFLSLFFLFSLRKNVYLCRTQTGTRRCDGGIAWCPVCNIFKVIIYDNTLNFAITNFFSFSERYLQ